MCVYLRFVEIDSIWYRCYFALSQFLLNFPPRNFQSVCEIKIPKKRRKIGKSNRMKHENKQKKKNNLNV